MIQKYQAVNSPRLNKLTIPARIIINSQIDAQTTHSNTNFSPFNKRLFIHHDTPTLTENETNSMSLFLTQKIDECFQSPVKKRYKIHLCKPFLSPKAKTQQLDKVIDQLKSPTFDESRSVSRFKELLDISQNVSSINKSSTSHTRYPSVPLSRKPKSKKVKVMYLKSQSTRRNKYDNDEYGNNKACLKILHPRTELEYHNVNRYFELREKGFDNYKAAAIANRIRCNEMHENNSKPKKAYYQQAIDRAMNKKLNEMVLNAKKDYMGKLYYQYIDNYKHHREDLVKEVGEVYNNELTKINNVLYPQLKPTDFNKIGFKTFDGLKFVRSRVNEKGKSTENSNPLKTSLKIIKSLKSFDSPKVKNAQEKAEYRKCVQNTLCNMLITVDNSK